MVWKDRVKWGKFNIPRSIQAVLILLIFWVVLMAGCLAEVGGMILAIPTYTILRVIAKEFLNQFKFVQSITKSI